MRPIWIVLAVVVGAALLGWALVVGRGAQPGPPGEHVAVLGPSAESLPLELYMVSLPDPRGELTIEQASAPTLADRFVPTGGVATLSQSFGAPPWLRFTVRNPSDQPATYYVQVSTPSPNAISLYAPTGPTGAYAAISSTAPALGGAPLPLSRSFVLPVTIPADSEVIYFARSHPATLSARTLLTLWEPEAFERIDKLQVGVWGAIVGSLLMTAALSLFLFIGLHDRNYLWMSAFAASYGLLNAASGSAGLQLLWPNQPGWWGPVYGALVVLTIITFVAFADAFLELRQRLPWAHRLAVLAMASSLALLLLIPLGQIRLAAALIIIVGTIASVGIVVSALMLARRPFKPARYFLLALSLPIVMSVIANVARLGINAWEPWFEVGPPSLILVLLLILSLGLADNINQLRRETAQNAGRLGQYLDAIPVGVAVYDPRQFPIYVNEATAHIIRARPQTGTRTYSEGQSDFPSYIAGTDSLYPVQELPLMRAFAGEAARADDLEMQVHGGRVALDTWARPLLDEAGQVEAVVTTFLDITERRATEAELASYREHLEELVEARTESERQQREVAEALQATAATLTRSLDRSEVLRAILSELERVADYDGALVALMEDGRLVVREATGAWGETRGNAAPLDGRVPLPDALGRAQTRLCASVPTEAASPSQVVVLPLMNGGEVLGLLSAAATCPAGFSPEERRVLQAFADQAALAVTNARLLEQAQTAAAVEERERLARDLHDAVTQTLCSANLLAGTALSLWSTAPPAARRPVEDLQWMLVSAVAEMRLLLMELRPAALASAPLDSVLRHVVDAFSGRTHLPVTFHLDVAADQPPEDVRFAVYRITQEAFNNIASHAQARHVTLWLEATADRLSLSISDDGRGFDPRAVEADHFGLAIMQERAEEVGLTLDVSSCLGQGTNVVLQWSDKS